MGQKDVHYLAVRTEQVVWHFAVTGDAYSLLLVFAVLPLVY